MPEQEKNTAHFIDLIRKSRRGKFKIYIGMSAGVGKTYPDAAGSPNPVKKWR